LSLESIEEARLDSLPAGDWERCRWERILGFNEVGKARGVHTQDPDEELSETLFRNRESTECPVERLQEVPGVGERLERTEVGKNPLERGFLGASDGLESEHKIGDRRFLRRGAKGKTRSRRRARGSYLSGRQVRRVALWRAFLEVQERWVVGRKLGFINGLLRGPVKKSTGGRGDRELGFGRWRSVSIRSRRRSTIMSHIWDNKAFIGFGHGKRRHKERHGKAKGGKRGKDYSKC